MSYHADIARNETEPHSARVFLLGMAVAFFISLSISYASNDNIVEKSTLTNCADPISLSRAEERSRNGIATAC